MASAKDLRQKNKGLEVLGSYWCTKEPPAPAGAEVWEPRSTVLRCVWDSADQATERTVEGGGDDGREGASAHVQCPRHCCLNPLHDEPPGTGEKNPPGRPLLHARGVQDEPSQHTEALSLLKIQKLARHGGGHDTRECLWLPVHLSTTMSNQVIRINNGLHHFGRLRWVDHLSSGIQDQPGHHGEIQSLLKIQKLASCGDGHLSASQHSMVEEGRSSFLTLRFMKHPDLLLHFGSLRQADHSRSGVRDQSGQHGKTLSLLKIQKLARHSGMGLYSQLLRRLRHENRLNPGDGGCIRNETAADPNEFTTAIFWIPFTSKTSFNTTSLTCTPPPFNRH
ncbi:hypothetical protein AAY473_017329 [Plecturocebus cupreus]